MTVSPSCQFLRLPLRLSCICQFSTRIDERIPQVDFPRLECGSQVNSILPTTAVGMVLLLLTHKAHEARSDGLAGRLRGT